MSVKWLRRIKVTAEPHDTKDETSKYSDLEPMAARPSSLFMEVKSVITAPSGTQKMQGPGLTRSRASPGPASAGVRASKSRPTAARPGREAALDGPVLPKALTRFRMPWRWNGGPSELQSRAVDETGAVQPSARR